MPFIFPHVRRIAATAALCAAFAGTAGTAASAAQSTPDPRPQAAGNREVAFSAGTRTSRSIQRRTTGTQGTTGSAQSGKGGLVSFSPKSFFYDDISAAPLDPNSAAIGGNVAAQVRDHWGGVAAFNAHAWNAVHYVVDAATPRVRVKWSNCFNFGWTPDGIYTGDKVFVDVPIPANAVSSTGTDGAMTIYEPGTDTLWEFWTMKKDATGQWASCQGGRIDKASRSAGQFPVGFGVSAAGISMTGGTISAAEARSGKIEHAMYLAVIDARYFDQVSWPAVRSDGYTKDPNTPMEGQRLRLDPSLNVDALPGLTPFARTVAKAAQKYGFIVSDKGGAVALIGEAGQSLVARTGSDPWSDILGTEDYKALAGFPWDRIQALPKDYGKR